MKEKIKIGAICLIIGAAIATFLCKKYWPTTIRITDSHIGETQHTVPTENININKPEDCQIAKDCANSNIQIKANMENNKLIGTAYDDCKSVDFMFEFAARNTARHIIQLGMGWDSKIGYFAHPGYFYQLDFAAIGCSFIIPKDKNSFGVEFMAQKAFK